MRQSKANPVSPQRPNGPTLNTYKNTTLFHAMQQAEISHSSKLEKVRPSTSFPAGARGCGMTPSMASEEILDEGTFLHPIVQPLLSAAPPLLVPSKMNLDS